MSNSSRAVILRVGCKHPLAVNDLASYPPQNQQSMWFVEGGPLYQTCTSSVALRIACDISQTVRSFSAGTMVLGSWPWQVLSPVLQQEGPVLQLKVSRRSAFTMAVHIDWTSARGLMLAKLTKCTCGQSKKGDAELVIKALYRSSSAIRQTRWPQRMLGRQTLELPTRQSSGNLSTC